MEFYEVIRTRRSVRSYSPKPIPEDKLRRVLDAARVAPSGANRQPWKFIVVRNEDLKRKVAEACNHQMFISKAPVVIVACGRDIGYNRGGYMGSLSMVMDVTIAMTHLVLAARAEGLGTCWIGAFNNEELKKILEIPPEYNVVAITPLGYPKDEAFTQSMNRKSLEEIVCYEKFA
ncbi:nitroreductase family protein [Candidatus Bathyarchaeota archaeon]|nr:nitroreductase family protein [Candidatus Bathyarchaeota archaeon]